MTHHLEPTMTTSTPRALIIGGSLSGLFAATSLRAAGWDVQVFERSPHELSGRGGGIVLQPDVLEAFNYAGVAHDDSIGVRSGDRIVLGQGGNVLQRAQLPQVQSSWNTLYALLRRALPDGVVQHGQQLDRYQQDGDTITAHFTSGRKETGQLLVGADGPSSAVRAQVLPDSVPAYAGYVAWRGLVPEHAVDSATHALLNEVFAFQQGQGHQLLEYMVPGQDESVAPGARRWNWVWYRNVAPGAPLAQLLTDNGGRRRRYSLHPGAVKQADLDRLLDDARAMLAPPFRQLIEATAQPFLQTILDLEVPRMVFGRAVLIGDAAFIPRPHTAGGAAKAAANAHALAHALRYSRADGALDIDAALARWEPRQLHSGHQLVQWGVQAGRQIMGTV
jgi:2-polyprenyl-6-methoxyphenol hydroxylase-like FAD-dependent oxidoreductase